MLTWRDYTLFLACTQSLCWETSGTTVLGTGSSGSNSDQFNNPYHLVIGSSGSFYVADYNNHRIQKFSASSLIGITVAGQGNANLGSTAYYLNEPAYVLLDSSGNLYVSDSQNHRVQYFASGSMTGITIAGTGKFSNISVLHWYRSNHSWMKKNCSLLPVVLIW